MGTVFGSRNELKDKKMVGCYIPRSEAERISLHSILTNTSRSRILENLLTNYLKKVPDTEQLIQDMAVKALKDWQKKQIEKIGTPGWGSAEQISRRWTDYRDDLLKDLKTQRIPVKLIKEIIDALEEMLTL